MPPPADAGRAEEGIGCPPLMDGRREVESFEPMVRPRVRIRFCKQGDLRLIGHRDLMRCVERLFRRAGLAMGMSEGFHPKPRMTFPLPLAVGIEGLDEVMEIELTDTPQAEPLLRLLSSQAPAGLAFRSVELLTEGQRKAQPRSASYRATIPAPFGRGWKHASAVCGPRRPGPVSAHGVRRSSTCADLEAISLREGVLGNAPAIRAGKPRRTARRAGRPRVGRCRAAKAFF